LGQPLTLVAQASNHYRLLDEEGEMLLEGQIGRVAEDHGISLYVSELIARPGTRFDLKKTGWLTAVKTLQKTLKVSEKGKKTGVFLLTLEDPDADRAVAILNAIANVYLRQNVERKSEEAQKALEFLQGQLPKLKAQLETSESRLNDYRLQRGSVDVGLEAEALLDQSAKLEQQISELKLKKLELRRRFTDNHPVIQSLEDKLGRLQTEQQTLEQRIKALPSTEQEVLRLMRDVKVQTELYTLLLNKTQELEVARAGTIGNVRVLDYAVRPDRPVKPKRALIVALGLVAGAFLGILLVFVRKAMQQGIQSPDEIEKRLGLSVYASVPHSEAQKKLHEQMKKGRGSREYLLARVDDTDLAIESLRSLRTNLHFGMMDADNNRILITGPAPGVGKSFVSANLASVLASADKRVLLIDADLRKGHLHTYFSLSHKPGLSECIRGDMSLSDAVQPSGQDHLDILSTGAYPPNPSELLMSEAFGKLLTDASTRYDLILIDTPPVLAVTDAVVIGKLVGTAFLLLRAGRHPLGEIQQAQRQLENGGVKIKGVIFNDIQPKRSQYGYYGSYHYAYK
ncbi:MAG: polysaccharide biosynthesis tyrosine autokinase, partial [Gammaproteobacteria bacterium]